MNEIKNLLPCFALLIVLACLRPPEYDEAYSIFLTSAHCHPVWPSGRFSAASVRSMYLPNGGFRQIAGGLRDNDVHPPLYFWTLLVWRALFGPGWLVARVLSVLYATAGLGVLARIAGDLGIPPRRAVFLCLTSYAFAYTSLLARNFALADLLTLLGVLLTLRHCEGGETGRTGGGAWLAGLCLGAATFTNYLAVFPAGAALVYLVRTSGRRAVGALFAFALFLPADAYFLAAQHDSRGGQFPPFSLTATLMLLAKDSGAAWFGALPLAAGRLAPFVTVLLILLAFACILRCVRNPPRHAGFLAALALATPAGLLALAASFHTTPIEIRYLAPSLPYLALLFAAPSRRQKQPALPSLGTADANAPRTKSFLLLFFKKEALPYLLLATQTAGVATLALTAQPQARAAREAAALAMPGTLVLVPYGNDGVGIPGPFIAAAPDGLTIQLIHADDLPDLGGRSRLILVALGLDSASRAAVAQAERRFAAGRCWQVLKVTPLVRLYGHACGALPRH